MTVEQQLAAALAQATLLTAQATSHDALMENARATATAAVAERDTLRGEVARLQAELLAANTSNTSASADAAQAREQLKTQVSTLASARTAALVGAAGTSPVEGAASGLPATSGQSLMEQYNALADPLERAKFFQKNKSAFARHRSERK